MQVKLWFDRNSEQLVVDLGTTDYPRVGRVDMGKVSDATQEKPLTFIVADIRGVTGTSRPFGERPILEQIQADTGEHQTQRDQLTKEQMKGLPLPNSDAASKTQLDSNPDRTGTAQVGIAPGQPGAPDYKPENVAGETIQVGTPAPASEEPVRTSDGSGGAQQAA